ncbi:MAG TPA: hypothetical protein VFU15_13780 [Bacteroidia bacterium]|nr:hypothetical protein [Bacteroidia bacterium]
MGRTASDDLFRLVKSLHRSEKRYFRIFSKRHVIGDGNNYVRLFDAIDRQAEYNEKELLEKLPFLRPRLMADQKNHLYWQVLRSLVVFSSGNSIGSQLRFRLSSFDFLYAKGLYVQCGKVIAKTKSLAIHYEKHLVVLECLEREKKLELQLFNLKSSPKKIARINAEREAAIAKYTLENAYGRLSEEMFFIMSEEMAVRSEKNKKRSRAILNDPLLQKAPAGGTLHSLFNYHRTLSLYCYSHSDFRGFYFHCRAIVKLMDANRDVLAESPKNYIVAIQNLLIAQKNLRLYAALFRTLRKLKLFEAGSESLRAQVFAITHDIELTIYIDTGQFEKGALLADAITRGLDQYRNYLSSRYGLLFCFNVAYNLIGCEKFRAALNWLNKVINFPGAQSAMPDIFQTANIISLIAHYELGHSDLLDYRISAMTKTFRKKHALYELESLVLSILSRAVVAPPEKRKRLFAELAKKLARLHRDPEKRRAFSSFDFLTWAKSKASEKTMSEVIRSRGKRS